MMKFLCFLVLAVTALCSNVSLPAYPLAVKSPYLSTWFPGGGSGEFPTTQPFFWRRNPLTWLVLARVNDEAFCLLGCTGSSISAAKQMNIEFTATHTLVTLQAGSKTLLLDFFSPVSLTDYVRQSIPFSYLTVSIQNAEATDTVDILSAIDDTWTAQNETQLVFSKGQTSLLYQLSGVNSIPLTEYNDMATYGQIVLAANCKVSSLTYQTGSTEAVLAQFTKAGTLTSPKSPAYVNGDLVAFSYRIQNQSGSPAVSFAIGLVREPTIMWLNEPQAAYYQSEFNSTETVVDHFFMDETAARTESNKLDSQVQKLGQSISSNYTDLLESTVRQIWGGFELTVPMNNKSTSMAKAFMKEISTDGNVNTLADLVPKSLPVFYTLAPDYIRLLVEPILEYTLQWPAQFAFHDLGKSYPNATGETVAGEEMLLLDQTSVIHWMAYAYQKASGNTEWIKPYLAPMQKYAGYLAEYGLYPPSQKSSVDSIGPAPNQTILAIYSAIGLTAFGALSGDSNYTNIGRSFAPKIIEMGIDSQHTHLKAHYNDSDSTWISAYPFAFDDMLGLNTFNSSIAKLQSEWYEKQLVEYGMQFYSGVPYIVADFALWTAATSSATVLNGIVNGVHRVLTSDLNVVVGPTQWNVTGENQGHWFETTDKSIVGSYFMPVAIKKGKK